MAQTFPPAIKALAHQHRLGTPVQLYTRVVSVRVLFGLLIFWVPLDMLFTLSLFTNTGHSKDLVYKNPVNSEVALLLITALLFSTFWFARSIPDYCRCTEGFLVLKRGNPPKLLHAVRWDDVTNTRTRKIPVSRGPQYYYYVSTRHGEEIQIRSFSIWDRSLDIWDYCDEQLNGKQTQGKRSRKRV